MQEELSIEGEELVTEEVLEDDNMLILDDYEVGVGSFSLFDKRKQILGPKYIYDWKMGILLQKETCKLSTVKCQTPAIWVQQTSFISLCV